MGGLPAADTVLCGVANRDKRQLLSQLAGLACVLEADLSSLRVARPWDIDQYELGVLTKSDVRHVRREELDAYLERERQAQGDRLSSTQERAGASPITVR